MTSGGQTDQDFLLLSGTGSFFVNDQFLQNRIWLAPASVESALLFPRN